MAVGAREDAGRYRSLATRACTNSPFYGDDKNNDRKFIDDICNSKSGEAIWTTDTLQTTEGLLKNSVRKSFAIGNDSILQQDLTFAPSEIVVL